MGGIGKTELAMVVANQLAEQFPDGQIVVELFGTSNPLTPERAVQEAIRAFDREAKLPDDLPSLQALYRQHCSGKRLLVLADDAKDEAQVRPLLPPAGCALLGTSRPHIELEGMQTHALGTLSPAEAEALLLQICPRIGDDAPELAKLCGYLPLALRVSATFLKRRPTRPVAAYLQNLRDEQARMTHLRDPKDPALNVEVSLALSYNALSAEAQQAFRQLGVFVGDFTLEAAEAVVAVDSNTATDLLEELYLNSLLEYDPTTERYKLHDLTRDFALARLDDERPTRLRHAWYYAQIAKNADNLYWKGQVFKGLTLFDQERHQIEAGWRWVRASSSVRSMSELVLTYTDAIGRMSELRYNTKHERIPHLEIGLKVAQQQGRRFYEARILGNLGRSYWLIGDPGHAAEILEQALTIIQDLANQQHKSEILNNLGLAFRDLSRPYKSIEYHEQAILAAREEGNRRIEGDALGNLGIVYWRLDDLERAVEFLEQDVAISHEIGNSYGESNALGILGLVYVDLGKLHTAIEYQTQAMTIASNMGDRRGESNALGNLGIAYWHLGDLERAIEFLERDVSTSHEVGNYHGEALALGMLGNIYRDKGYFTEAIDNYKEALKLFNYIGDHKWRATFSWDLGKLYAHNNDLARAVAYMKIYVDYKKDNEYIVPEKDLKEFERVHQRLVDSMKGFNTDTT
jgi:tetratricopeptide (TPR) repeat protein